MPAWTYYAAKDEPPFWYRPAHEYEIDGVDPLTGMVIAYTKEECDQRDEDMAEQIAAHGQFGVGA